MPSMTRRTSPARGTMRALAVNFLLLQTALAAPTAPFTGTIIERDSQLFAAYDYVIVGGGVSGLVVANRLTEKPWNKVLVIEAGRIDYLEPKMTFPRYLNDASIGNAWPYVSATMPELNNRTHTVWSAKVLGGGSAINGMAFDRGSQGDYNLWGQLIGDNGWSWSGLLPYFKKSETFTPPTAQQVADFGITYDMAAHGTSGPVKASFPPFITSLTKNFLRALTQVGIPTPQDGATGALGGFWSPNSIDPVLRERSYARNTYHTLAEPRPNYHVLANTTVTKILGVKKPNGAVYISGVEYISSTATSYSSATKKIAKAAKEVIMAAGAVHTPRLLQLSGIGPKPYLDSLNIPNLIDLPGVGENLQDHPVTFLQWQNTVPLPPGEPQPFYQFDPVLDAQYGAEYLANRTGPWTASSGSALAFLTPADIGFPTSLLTAAESQPAGTGLRAGLAPQVVAGYEATKAATLAALKLNQVAAIESVAVGGAINSLMKPLSRGYVQITSADPLAAPAVDFRPCTNPFDWTLMVASTKWHNTVLAQAPALKDDLGTTVVAPPVTATDAEIKESLRASMWPSFAHLVGTCAMLPRAQGGCVDARLKVYGAGGRLRVVDASMMPVVPGTHTQSTVYAVAERVADLIKMGL